MYYPCDCQIVLLGPGEFICMSLLYCWMHLIVLGDVGPTLRVFFKESFFLESLPF